MEKTKLYILEKELGPNEIGETKIMLTYVKSTKEELMDVFSRLTYIRNSVHSIPVFKDPN